MTEENRIFSTKILMISAMMVVTGSINTLAFKFQDKENYKHGLSMTVQMFIGMWLNILLLCFPL